MSWKHRIKEKNCYLKSGWEREGENGLTWLIYLMVVNMIFSTTKRENKAKRAPVHVLALSKVLPTRVGRIEKMVNHSKTILSDNIYICILEYLFGVLDCLLYMIFIFWRSDSCNSFFFFFKFEFVANNNYCC